MSVPIENFALTYAQAATAAESHVVVLAASIMFNDPEGNQVLVQYTFLVIFKASQNYTGINWHGDTSPSISPWS